MQAQSFFSLIRSFTFKRNLNAMKVLSSFYWSKWNKKATQWGMPISVSIEPTTSCNLRCPECPSGLRSFTRPTGMLDEKFFRKSIDEMSSHLLYITFYFQGEPYLNPNFLEMVKYANSKRIYTSTSTNAHYLDDATAKRTVESGLERLIISIDGTTQETYSSYRVGGNLDKVIEGTKNVLKWKKQLRSSTPHLIFQFLVVKQNEHQVEHVKFLAEELGVDEVLLKTAQINDFENGNALIPTQEKYSRYKQKADGTWVNKNKFENHCWKMWNSCVITWDGAVVPCCFDKDATHRLGMLTDFSMKQIWHSEPYNRFRAAVLTSRKDIDICKNCSEGTKVWAD
ncbi:MAG: radical SAM/SPASM domain-containing protein [Bacteroidetes bacterium]|nr:radical SAM/SPASM domain-containing protein [Bacteroidota bacterium]